MAEVPAGEVPAGEVPAGAPGDGQHYESFLVRVLLNEDGSVRRTTAQHIRTGSERHWPGLDRQALPEFIETAIASAAPSSTAPAEPPPVEPPSAEPPPVEPPSDQARQAEAIHGAPAELVTVDGTPTEPVAMRGAPAPPGPARQTSPAALSVEPAVLRAAEPFTMTMTIDLAEPASHADRLAYSAVIVARPMAGGPKLTVAESDGLLATTSPAITIYGAGLPPGAYRLDGAVSLREPGRNQPIHLAPWPKACWYRFSRLAPRGIRPTRRPSRYRLSLSHCRSAVGTSAAGAGVTTALTDTQPALPPDVNGGVVTVLQHELLVVGRPPQ